VLVAVTPASAIIRLLHALLRVILLLTVVNSFVYLY
jgi:hypothetical protein